MPSLDEVRGALSRHRPHVIDDPKRRRAAVAMVLRDAEGPLDVLFIERARRYGDPWSGHMALPGGRVDWDDPDPRAAAERETHEEVGLPLAGEERLGRLDDAQGRPATASSLVISAFVYFAASPGPLIPNYEVREAFWFPLAQLLDPERRVDHPAVRGSRTRFPGILVGKPERHVVWGLTYRFLEGFFRILGRPLPDRWQDESRPVRPPIA